jgi:3-dehydroquinate synthase
MHLTIEQRFAVNYSFPVVFCRDLFGPENEILADLLVRAGSGRHRLLACIDSGVSQACPDLARRLADYVRAHAGIMELAAPPVVVSGGESCKNDPTILPRLHDLIGRHHLCRQSFILAIGGGAVLDTVGFAAATAHRGLRLIRLPTTVLGQNDAGVGVKNSVNFGGRKNFLGTFAPPYAVINDFTFLDSLPPRQLRAGIVEAVKVALIKDRNFFDYLRGQRHQLATFEAEYLEEMIRRCAVLHIEHIGSQGDPFEFGSSRPLDFGHWSAHKLEEISSAAFNAAPRRDNALPTGKPSQATGAPWQRPVNYTTSVCEAADPPPQGGINSADSVPCEGLPLNHGEAVAIGIGLDTLYSREAGLLQTEAAEAILSTLEDLGLSLYHPALEQLEIVSALGEFREHLGGELTIPLLREPGCLHEVHAIDEKLMQRCIGYLADRHHQRPITGKPLTGVTPQDLAADQSSVAAAGGSGH